MGKIFKKLGMVLVLSLLFFGCFSKGDKEEVASSEVYTTVLQKLNDENVVGGAEKSYTEEEAFEIVEKIKEEIILPLEKGLERITQEDEALIENIKVKSHLVLAIVNKEQAEILLKNSSKDVTEYIEKSRSHLDCIGEINYATTNIEAQLNILELLKNKDTDQEGYKDFLDNAEEGLNKVMFVEDEIDTNKELKEILVRGKILDTVDTFILASEIYFEVKDMAKAIEYVEVALERLNILEDNTLASRRAIDASAMTDILNRYKISKILIKISNVEGLSEEEQSEVLEKAVENLCITLCKLDESGISVEDNSGELMVELVVNIEKITDENSEIQNVVSEYNINIEESVNRVEEILEQSDGTIDLEKIENKVTESLSVKVQLGEETVEGEISGAYLMLSLKQYALAKAAFLELEINPEVIIKKDYLRRVKFGLAESYKGLDDINNAIETFKMIKDNFLDYNTQNRAIIELRYLYEGDNRDDLIIQVPDVEVKENIFHIESEVLTIYTDLTWKMKLLSGDADKTSVLFNQPTIITENSTGRFTGTYEINDIEKNNGIYFLEIEVTAKYIDSEGKEHSVTEKYDNFKVQIGEQEMKAKIKDVYIDLENEKIVIEAEGYNSAVNTLTVGDRVLVGRVEDTLTIFEYEFDLKDLSYGYTEYILELNEEEISNNYFSVIEVRKPALGALKFAKNEYSLLLHNEMILEISKNPVDAYIEELVWTSTPEGIVEVDENGKIKAIGEGEAELKVSATVTNEQGNIETITAKSVIIVPDTTAPEKPEIIGLEEGIYRTEKSFTINGEPGALIEYSLNEGETWNTYNGEIYLTVDDVYTIKMRQTDEAGNISEETEGIEVTIDTTLPAIPEVEGIEAGLKNKDQKFTVTGTDSNKLEYSLDNGQSWTTYYEEVILTEDGTYKVTARQTDELGKISPLSAVIVLEIDKTSPMTPVITGIESGSYPNTQEFTIEGEETVLQYSLDGGINWLDYTDKVLLEAGEYRLVARQVDEAGNISEIGEEIIISIDMSKPEAPEIKDIVNGIYSEDKIFTITGEAESIIEYSLDGGANWIEYASSVKISEEKKYEITAKQTDEAGNISVYSETITVEIDKTAPYIIKAELSM